MAESIVGGGGSADASRDVGAQDEIAVEALPYPARRSLQAQEWLKIPSGSSSSDSSSQGVHTEGGGGMSGSGGRSGGGSGGGGGGGGGSGRSGGGSGGLGSGRDRKARKSWGESAAGLALSAPLLPSSEFEHGRSISSSRAIPEDKMTLDTSNQGGGSNGNLSDGASSVEAQGSRDIPSEGGAGPPNSRGPGLRRVCSRVLDSGIIPSDTKTTDLFALPFTCEGDGSVYPIALPLAKRRGYEVELIKQFDRLAININAGDFWTIIDASWMNNWVDFVMGNKPSPGPISNYKLYDQRSSLTVEQRESLLVKHAVSTTGGALSCHPDLKIKQGLMRVKDYRVIHPLVWFIFREIYDTDGSPDIFRWKSDVYSAEVVGVRKARLVEELQTKAIYELRRFSSRLKDAMEEMEEEHE